MNFAVSGEPDGGLRATYDNETLQLFDNLAEAAADVNAIRGDGPAVAGFKQRWIETFEADADRVCALAENLEADGVTFDAHVRLAQTSIAVGEHIATFLLESLSL